MLKQQPPADQRFHANPPHTAFHCSELPLISACQFNLPMDLLPNPCSDELTGGTFKSLGGCVYLYREEGHKGIEKWKKYMTGRVFKQHYWVINWSRLAIAMAARSEESFQYTWRQLDDFINS
ncbi:hypothetical protein GOBAR_DD28172 [Gossypium barbadense]|nr:hypothetical protein GOBAR_DD28172 [Gossypium barbadense]